MDYGKVLSIVGDTDEARDTIMLMTLMAEEEDGIRKMSVAVIHKDIMIRTAAWTM